MRPGLMLFADSRLGPGAARSPPRSVASGPTRSRSWPTLRPDRARRQAEGPRRRRAAAIDGRADGDRLRPRRHAVATARGGVAGDRRAALDAQRRRRGAARRHLPHADAPGADEALLGAARRVRGLGSVIELEEELLDAATAVMGCARAYLARRRRGADRSRGRRRTGAGAQRAAWSARRPSGTGDLLASPRGEIETAIASPGGSTEAGLDAFAAAGGPQAFDAAVVASLERMRGTR